MKKEKKKFVYQERPSLVMLQQVKFIQQPMKEIVEI